MSLDGPLDAMNTNAHGQIVSPQTGLPPLNPNNPPQPPPSVSSPGGPGQFTGQSKKQNNCYFHP